MVKIKQSSNPFAENSFVFIIGAFLVIILFSMVLYNFGQAPILTGMVGEWGMFGFGPNHTAYTSEDGPITNSILWSYTTGNVVMSSPSVANDIVYVGSNDNNVYALNATNGNQIWNYPTGDAVRSSPSVANDIVYVGSHDDKVYALNATNGSKIWDYTTSSNVAYSPTFVNDIIYVGSDSSVYALNATNGSNIWNYTAGNWVSGSPAVANDIVYIGSYDDKVHAFNATNGSKIWDYTTGSNVYSPPAVANDVVYVGSGDKKVYALNATNGSLIWNYTTGNTIVSSPAVANDIVYVGSYDGKVYALNATTGSQIWNYTTGEGISSSPAVANDVVYIGSWNDKVYALNATNGSNIWDYTTGGDVSSSPAVADGIMYIGSNDYKIYAFSSIPYIAFGDGTENNNTAFNRSWIYVNVTATTTRNETSITFNLYNSTVLINSTTNTTPEQRTINWTGLNDDAYYYNVTVCDEIEACNTTETRTLILDSTYPQISYGTATEDNNGIVLDNWIYVNVDVVEDNPQNITFYLYNLTTDNNLNTTTYSMSSQSANTTINWTSLGNGTYYYNVTVVDRTGYSNSTGARNITINTSLIQIAWGSGTEDNGAIVSRDWIYVNVSVDTTNEANTTFSLYNLTALINSTTNTTPEQRTINWTNLDSGNYSYNVTACDGIGVCDLTGTRTIFLYPNFPRITIEQPPADPNNITESTTPLISGTIEDQSPDTVLYSIDSGTNKTACRDCLSFNIERWNMSLGYTSSFKDVAIDSNDSMVVIKLTTLSVNDNYTTIKYDSNGNQLWNVTYDSGGSDHPESVAVDSQDNIIVTGRANWTSGGNWNSVTIKYNGSNGNHIWNATYNVGNDYGKGVAVDSDDNVILAGDYEITGENIRRAFTIKYNGSNGSKIWNTTFEIGSGKDYYIGDVAVDPNDDSIAIIGNHWPEYSSNGSYTIAKYNSTGSYLWNTTFGSGRGYYNNPGDIIIDSQGEIIAIGCICTNTDVDTCTIGAYGDNFDFLTIKYNGSNGTQVWNASYNGGVTDEPFDIAIDSDGDYIITGRSNLRSSTQDDFFTIEYNTSGDQISSVTTISNSDSGLSVDIDSNDKVIVTGGFYASYDLIKYPSYGGSLALDYGYHNVTIWVNDTAGNINSTTRYFTIDTSSPIVSLSSPGGGFSPRYGAAVYLNTPTQFTYQVADGSEISSCSLLIDDEVVATSALITKNEIMSFTATFSQSRYYNWKVECEDEFGTTGSSETRYINVYATGGGGEVGGVESLEEEIVACADECSGGARECVDDKNYRTCSDVDGCLKWTTVGCGEEVCEDGSCKSISETKLIVGLSSRYGCTPEWECSGWSGCELSYNILGEIKGEQTRTCEDLIECAPSRIETQGCSIAKPIDVTASSYEGADVYNIYKENTSTLVARLTRELESLDIRLSSTNIGEVQAPHCYNRVKDGDEEEIDCGGSCTSCEKIIRRPLGGIPIQKIVLWIVVISSALFLIIYLIRPSFPKTTKPKKIKVEDNIKNINEEIIKLKEEENKLK